MQGTRSCSICEEEKTQFCKEDKCFAHPHMMVGMDVLFVTAQQGKCWSISGL